ncbi:MAG: hypothetical protein COC24_000560 [Alphaproteobacteria bacterium]|nr:hypothetical protein [Alphaproteobacteria bacterium]
MTPFTDRYKNLLINKTNLTISAVVLALALAANLFDFMTEARAFFLFATYCVFMIIYQALNARFLPEDKYQIFVQQGQTVLGNPIPHLPQLGRVCHYLLIGGMFSVALGAEGADPTAFFRGFSSMGFLYAAAYGAFTEVNIKRQKKQNGDDKK